MDGCVPESKAENSPLRALRRRGRALLRWIGQRFTSSLERRIILLNLAGLVALLLGYLYLNQFRAGLIEARVQSLLIQGQIIAGAIAASATVESDGITLDPEKLLQQQSGEGATEDSPLEFSINPERVAPVLRRLVTPTKTRARVFDRDGIILMDTARFFTRGDVMRQKEPGPPPANDDDLTLIQRTFSILRQRFGRIGVPINEESNPIAGRSLPEVQKALDNESSSIVRLNQRGQTIVSVAVPVIRFRTVQGALLLSTQGGDIDEIIASERWAIVEIFLVAAAVMLILSILLARTIAGPMQRLAAAARSIRRGAKSRVEIPDFTGRSDEIGLLSGSLRDMTRTLYNRIDAIESFAADVAHELKNPLTSLRSAVETLPLARNDESRKRLLEVIQHDVRRLDRLISDISDASRLDAELQRQDAAPVDMAQLVETIAGMANELRREGQAPIQITLPKTKHGKDQCFVIGHDSRLAQVLNNLIDNARSFSPEGAAVRVTLSRENESVIVRVEDNGPGIPDHALERIFERFYTDRPEEQGFGQNSGLGLSISRQIVEAHGGQIWAENRKQGNMIAGARFTVQLPAAAQE